MGKAGIIDLDTKIVTRNFAIRALSPGRPQAPPRIEKKANESRRRGARVRRSLDV